MNRLAVSLALLALQGTALGAQDAIPTADTASVVTGSVRSWRRGTTLANAFVTLELIGSAHAPPRLHATTDSAGRFAVRVPVGGAYLLSVSGTNAEARGPTRMPVHVRGGDTLRVDVFLAPYGFDLARRDAQLDSLARNRERWWSKGPRMYRATVKRDCFCLGGGVGEWTLGVRPETTVVLRKPAGEVGQPPIASIDSLFAWLESEIRDPGRDVEVRYDAALGYPTSIYTDTVSFFTDMWMRVQVRVSRGRG
jgi:hypothetical protein